MKHPKSRTPIPKVIIALLPRGWDERTFSLLFSESGTAVYEEEDAMAAFLVFGEEKKVEVGGIRFGNGF
jgi:hypothetical protein